jgi:hypothetical protein
MFDLPNLPKWHIDLPANLTNLATWKFLEESGNLEVAFDNYRIKSTYHPKLFRVGDG